MTSVVVNSRLSNSLLLSINSCIWPTKKDTPAKATAPFLPNNNAPIIPVVWTNVGNDLKPEKCSDDLKNRLNHYLDYGCKDWFEIGGIAEVVVTDVLKSLGVWVSRLPNDKFLIWNFSGSWAIVDVGKTEQLLNEFEQWLKEN